MRRSVAGLAVVLAAFGASLLASGAFASAAKPAVAKHSLANHRRSALMVFSHPLRVRGARIASVSGIQAPAGAVLAAVSSQKEIYAWQPTSAQETTPMGAADGGHSTCMVKVLSSGLESIACGSTAEVEERGIIGLSMPSKAEPNPSATALVPNGVTSVTVTDNDGATYSAAVSHNAVIIEDPDLAAVSFTLPDGGVNEATVSEATSR